MGDRPRSSSRGRMSEDKVRRKDLCGSVRVVYVLEKLLDVSGPGLIEAGHYTECPDSWLPLIVWCWANPRNVYLSCTKGDLR